MKSRLFSSSLPSLVEAAPQIPALFSNAYRAETIRQLQESGYAVEPEKLPKIQETALGFDPEEAEGSMPWVAERGMAVHRAYGEFLADTDPYMVANTSLNRVVDRARRLGHPVTGAPSDGADRPDGVGVYLPQTRPNPIENLVELKPKGTALTGGGPAQVARYQKSLEDCGLPTSLMPPGSPLANTVLPVPGYGDVAFEGLQDGIVGYTQLRRSPAPELLPQTQEAPAKEEVPTQQSAPSISSIYEYIRELADAVKVSFEVAVGLALLLVAIVILGLLLHIPPPVPA